MSAQPGDGARGVLRELPRLRPARRALPGAARHGAHCPRCGAALHLRKPRSLQRTWALVIAAAICYVPANLLPVMTVTSLGKTRVATPS